MGIAEAVIAVVGGGGGGWAGVGVADDSRMGRAGAPEGPRWAVEEAVEELLELSIFEKVFRVWVELVARAPALAGRAEGGDGWEELVAGGSAGEVPLGEKSTAHAQLKNTEKHKKHKQPGTCSGSAHARQPSPCCTAPRPVPPHVRSLERRRPTASTPPAADTRSVAV